MASSLAITVSKEYTTRVTIVVVTVWA